MTDMERQDEQELKEETGQPGDESPEQWQSVADEMPEEADLTEPESIEADLPEPEPVVFQAEADQPESSTEEHDRFKETTEKIWGSTKSAWSTAAFKAGQYKRLVQMKIDLAALHKKIAAAHADLGKLIDDLREEGRKSILTQPEVKTLLENLDNHKTAAATLEAEIEQTREQSPHSAAEEIPPKDEIH